MIPSLVAGEIRQALVDYLATTFGLADDDVRDALVGVPHRSCRPGIFRGPYLRVRTPFRAVEPTWAVAARLAARRVRARTSTRRRRSSGSSTPAATTRSRRSSPPAPARARPSASSCPMLDHCARERARGQPGIKALILYPMNALAVGPGRPPRRAASPNDARLAGRHAPGSTSARTGRTRTMGADHLIDDRHALRDDPPDILLTNYKMLDFLLLRREDRPLWAANEPDTPRATWCSTSSTPTTARRAPTWPCCCAASAPRSAWPYPARRWAPPHRWPPRPRWDRTPTRSPSCATSPARSSASTSTRTSVIGETRQTVDEACLPDRPDAPAPSTVRGRRARPDDDGDALAAAFCRRPPERAAAGLDPVELGERLPRPPPHPRRAHRGRRPAPDPGRHRRRGRGDERRAGPSELDRRPGRRRRGAEPVHRARCRSPAGPVGGTSPAAVHRRGAALDPGGHPPAARGAGPSPRFSWLDTPAAAATPRTTTEPRPRRRLLPAV
ncbi:MAG: hypothetical protein V9E94_14160 [Microthrixaceae bacterium]